MITIYKAQIFFTQANETIKYVTHKHFLNHNFKKIVNSYALHSCKWDGEKNKKHYTCKQCKTISQVYTSRSRRYQESYQVHLITK